MKVTVKRGVEGPRNDPYAFVEVTVIRQNGLSVTGHSGLIFWIKVNTHTSFIREQETFDRLFKEQSGLSFQKAEEIPDILEAKMLKQMTKEDQTFYWQCRSIEEQMMRNSY